LDFPLPVTSDSSTDSSIGMAVIKNGEFCLVWFDSFYVAVGILFLSHLEVEICMRGILTPPPISNERLKNRISTIKVERVIFSI